MKVLTKGFLSQKKEKKNLLPLCILEGLYIEKEDSTQRLNERNESGRGGLVRMIASRVT